MGKVHGSEEKRNTKPANNLTKVAKKPLKKKITETDRITEMVMNSLVQVKDGNGRTMQDIHKYIREQFAEEITKNRKNDYQKDFE